MTEIPIVNFTMEESKRIMLWDILITNKKQWFDWKTEKNNPSGH